VYPVPGRLGGLGAGSIIISVPVAPTVLPPRIAVAPFVPNVLAWPQFPAVGDSWGAVQVPAQPAPQVVGFSPILTPGGTGVIPPGDPSLAYTLSFLYAFLVTDANANVPWTQAFGYPLIKSPLSLFAHNPKEAGFNVDYLPALYLWRDDVLGGKFEREADDWEVETSTMTMLWAMPLGDQFRQRDRSQYVNQFVKSVVAGIEYEQTPSWVMPGDPNPQSSFRGSVLGQYTNMVRFRALSWKRSKIRIELSNVPKNTAGSLRDYSAVELKFEVRERLAPDLRRFSRLQQLEQIISNPTTNSLVQTEIDKN
jgi:hypothetical protein